MSVKVNLTIITKNDEADPEIGFLTKSILKPYGRATAIPRAWVLRYFGTRKINFNISSQTIWSSGSGSFYDKILGFQCLVYKKQNKNFWKGP